MSVFALKTQKKTCRREKKNHLCGSTTHNAQKKPLKKFAGSEKSLNFAPLS